MNYKRIYWDLIDKLSDIRPPVPVYGRDGKGYHDKISGFQAHHKVARLMGGLTTSENMVYLTLREHFTMSIIYALAYGEENPKTKLPASFILNNFGPTFTAPSLLIKMARRMSKEALSIISKELWKDDNYRLIQKLDRIADPDKYSEAIARSHKTAIERGTSKIGGAKSVATKRARGYDFLSNSKMANEKGKHKLRPWITHKHMWKFYKYADSIYNVWLSNERQLSTGLLRNAGFDTRGLHIRARHCATAVRYFNKYGNPSTDPLWIGRKELDDNL